MNASFQRGLLRWCLTAALLAMLGGVGAIGQPIGAKPVLHTALDPTDGAVIGQRIALYVDILFEGDMPHPPRVTIADIPGTQVLRFESQALTIRDRIDGKPYVGQRFEFAVYPRRGGALVIPAPDVTLLDRQGNVTGTAQAPSVRATVQVPPGVDESEPVIATTAFTMNENWSPEARTHLKPGDALIRTVRRTAVDIPAFAMRELVFTAPEGVELYEGESTTNDRVERGVLTGDRSDRVTYVFTKAGAYTLPPVEQPWWNIDDHALQNGRADGLVVTVEALPAAAINTRRQPMPAPLAISVALAFGLAALVVGGLLFFRRHGDDPETRAFRALAKACHSDDRAAIYRCFVAWRPLSSIDPARLDAAIAPVEAELFGGPSAPTSKTNPRALIADVRRMRRQTSSRSSKRPGSPLPALNP